MDSRWTRRGHPQLPLPRNPSHLAAMQSSSAVSAIFSTTVVYERALAVVFAIARVGFRMQFFRNIVANVLVAIFGKPRAAPRLDVNCNTASAPNGNADAVDAAAAANKVVVVNPQVPTSRAKMAAGIESMLGPKLSPSHREFVYSHLKQLASDNDSYFRSADSSAFGQRLADCCQEISVSADLIHGLVKQMYVAAQKCDYDENTPGNGFRSLICVSDMAAMQLLSTLRSVTENRGNLVFRIAHYCKEVEGFAAVLGFLILAFQQVIAGMDMFEENSLFPPITGNYDQYSTMLQGIECLDTSCFYARPLGFQFAPSVVRVFRVIGFVLATYSLSWEKGQGPINSLIHSGKYLLSPEQRAMRIVKVIRESDLEFCKGFWNLSEIGSMSAWFCPYMAISETREIGLNGPLPLRNRKGEIMLIQEPSSHTSPRPIPYRILSAAHREGLSPANTPNKRPCTPYLLIHCHGGGYVATSSKSHETYLRSWAKALDCTVISIDYSLAPENPYPRATEDVLYTYTWILNNPEKFGWTGEKVIMAGDSAGGNLIFSVALHLVKIEAARLPDALIPIYTPFLFQYLPSPSRILSFMDPLLHMGVVIRCAAAYTGAKVEGEEENAEESAANLSGNGHKSLFEYVGEVQKVQASNFFEFSLEDEADNDGDVLVDSVFSEEWSSDEESRDILVDGALKKLVRIDDQPRKRSLSQSLVDAAGHALDNLSDWFDTTPGTPIGFNDKPKLCRAATLTPKMAAKAQQEEAKEIDSHFSSLLKLKLPRDPLISPMYASNDVLKRLPPVWFIACQMDPLLDDTVSFARKLRDAGGQVRRVDLLDNIPHGFLNFTLVSPDCNEGSKLCINRIREAMGILPCAL